MYDTTAVKRFLRLWYEDVQKINHYIYYKTSMLTVHWHKRDYVTRLKAISIFKRPVKICARSNC